MSESQQYPYSTYLDIKFPALALVDVPALVSACKSRWYNQTLCKVNDSVVRLGVMQGQYHWHKHDNDDEFFFVLDGHFIIDLEGESIDLQPWQGYGAERRRSSNTRSRSRSHSHGGNCHDSAHGRCLTFHRAFDRTHSRSRGFVVDGSFRR